jgi:hypothetical protein
VRTHPRASRACWLFCCALLSIAVPWQPVRSDDAQEVVQQYIAVESWVAELSVSEMPRYKLGDKTLADIFVPGKILRHDDLGLQMPVQDFVRDLEQRSLARIVNAPKIVLNNGEQGSLQAGGVTIEATATISRTGIRLDIKLDEQLRNTNGSRSRPVSSALFALRRTRSPNDMGNRLIHLSFGEVKSGQPFALTLGPLPNAPSKSLVLFVLATASSERQGVEKH